MSRVPFRGLQRRKGDYEHLWLITFADLMVQLMAFFVVVYSFSMQDQEQANALLRSLRQELGVGKAAGTGQGILSGTTGIAPDRAADLEKLMNDMKTTDGPDAGVRMRVVSFRGAVLFEEGSGTVRTDFRFLMERLSQLVVEYPGFTLVCEGHAAPGERGRNGEDALAVSGLRAQATMRDLVARGVDAKLLAAEAHGDSQVDGDASSPEGRALQRRVKFRFQRAAER